MTANNYRKCRSTCRDMLAGATRLYALLPADPTRAYIHLAVAHRPAMPPPRQTLETKSGLQKACGFEMAAISRSCPYFPSCRLRLSFVGMFVGYAIRTDTIMYPVGILFGWIALLSHLQVPVCLYSSNASSEHCMDAYVAE